MACIITIRDQPGGKNERNELLLSAAILFVGCANVTNNGPSSSFALVSGSGTITINLLNADSAHHNQYFSFGTISTGTPIGDDLQITSNGISKTLDSGGSVLFTGGYPIVVGGFIDVDGDGGTTHMPDDGDYMVSKTVTISGNTIVTFTYPGDFTLVSGSGTITINLLNANTAHGGETFMFGTISTGTPLGGSATIDSDNKLLTLQDSGVDVVFPGGSQIVAGGFIDVDNDAATTHMADDGDYIASQTVTVAGNMIVVFTY